MLIKLYKSSGLHIQCEILPRINHSLLLALVTTLVYICLVHPMFLILLNACHNSNNKKKITRNPKKSDSDLLFLLACVPMPSSFFPYHYHARNRQCFTKVWFGIKAKLRDVDEVFSLGGK